MGWLGRGLEKFGKEGADMIVLSNLRLELDEPVQAVFARAWRALGLPPDAGRAQLVKRSLDARRGDLHFVCSVGICCEGEDALAARCPGATVRREQPLPLERGEAPLPHRPVVAGFGPAGMFAALLLARCGFRPIVLERGEPVEQRVQAVRRFWQGGALQPESNVQFGEGGAGTFSDGKLTTRIHDARCGYVLQELAAHGAPEEILWQAKPHIGTDRLRAVVRAIRQEILQLGGEVYFSTPVRELRLRDGALRGVRLDTGELPAEALVLAVGHSARDTFAMLQRLNILMEPKPFSVGVRIEHLQSEIDRALYGRLAGHPALPPGEYQLAWRENGRGVYTFCMCPGGLVVPAASEEGGVVTNGMSEYARDGRNANSALVVSVDPADWGGALLGGVALQRELERAAYRQSGGWRAPAQTVGRFLAGQPGMALGRVEPTYACGVQEGELAALFPPALCELLRRGLQVFDGRLRGFAAPDVLLTGVETRTSSPVRIPRGADYQSPGAQGLYPCGEGAGYAGGIMSAAVDGVRVAQQIIAAYRPGW